MQIFKFFAPLHLLHQKLGIVHRNFQRQLATLQCQQITRALGRAFECLVGLIEAGGLFQRQTLLALGSIGKAIRVNTARQLSITHSQLIEVQIETRLQLKQSKMTRSTHD